jgi:hypothetical protein
MDTSDFVYILIDIFIIIWSLRFYSNCNSIIYFFPLLLHRRNSPPVSINLYNATKLAGKESKPLELNESA